MSGDTREKLAKLAQERGLDVSVNLTPLEAYDAAIEFLDAYWKRGLKGSDEVASILSNMSRTVWADGWSGDPAYLHDWMDAVAKVKAAQNSPETAKHHA